MPSQERQQRNDKIRKKKKKEMNKVQWIINGVVLAGLITLGGYHLLKKEKIVVNQIVRNIWEYKS